MFWNKKKEELETQNKSYNLDLNIERQAIVNIIKLNCNAYKNDSAVLQTALCLGLSIMEDLATHEANYIKEVGSKRTYFKLPS
jgi:hypothetical protein